MESGRMRLGKSTTLRTGRTIRESDGRATFGVPFPVRGAVLSLVPAEFESPSIIEFTSTVVRPLWSARIPNTHSIRIDGRRTGRPAIVRDARSGLAEARGDGSRRCEAVAGQ